MNGFLLRIVLAERLPLMRALIKDILGTLPGLTLVAALDSHADLIAVTRRQKPDLVLLDWSLHGLEELTELRALQHAPQVFVTMSSRNHDQRAAVLAHGGVCLSREYMQRELRATLQPLVDGPRPEAVR